MSNLFIPFPDDSEAEDDKIVPTDNLILVGHVDDDSVCMEVYGTSSYFYIEEHN